AAILTRLESYSEAIAIGEMGTGKSSIAAAIAAGRSARRTIVLCPPHLVDKWQREFKAVWPAVRTLHLQTISDVDRFFGPQPDNAPLVAVPSETTALSASGLEHAYDYGGPAVNTDGSQGYSDINRQLGNVLSFRNLRQWSAAERPGSTAQFSDSQLQV